MSSVTFSQKVYKPIPPQKGSFPLDHESLCKEQMIKYMKCLRLNKNNNEKCRVETKDYLSCRMDNHLMTKEPWSKLGLADVGEDKQSVDRRS